MTTAKTIALIRQGIDYALDDYCRLSEKPMGVDVKPKEDQLKCALYRAFTEAGRVVHVEGGYARAKGKCDLMVAMRKPVGLELKVAWACTSWNNKPPEQAATWVRDYEKLKTLPDKGFGAGFFVLLFVYSANTVAEGSLRTVIADFGKPCLCTEPREINLWNGLNTLEGMAWRVF